MDVKGRFLPLETDHIEVMGRDKSIVSRHESSTKPTIRSIVDSDVALPKGAAKLTFNVKPNKLFLFNAETEERLI